MSADTNTREADKESATGANNATVAAASSTDEAYMREALELAVRGTGRVNPNPLVGAVIVKDGQVVGRGWHQAYGELHAERNALADCTADEARGATIYVTLEPCCHTGKTPPCTDAIIERGVARVVVGSADPNPLVAGGGIRALREAGIQVDCDVLRDECDQINEVFFHYIQTQTPYVVMKYAMTMDGKIATRTGASQWITGEATRNRVHEDRNRYMAIMVGVGTVIADDPSLTCRLEQGGRNPIRIVCDSTLRTPLSAQVVTTAHEIPTIIATCNANTEAAAPYKQAGCDVLVVGAREGRVDLRELMNALGQRGVDGILLEGGGELNWAALQSGIVNKVQAYIAPKLFGGADAPSPVRGLGVETPDGAIQLERPRVITIEDDILLESEVKACSPAL